MLVFLARKAIKKLKEKKFMGDLEELNSGCDDLKYLAVAEVKVDKEADVGLFGRPSSLLKGKAWLLDKLGRNRRVLAGLLCRPRMARCCFWCFSPPRWTRKSQK